MGYIFLIISVIIIDQITKYWAVLYLKNIETMPIIKNVFHFTYSENTGAAFGILGNQRTFLLVTTAIMIIIVSYLLYKSIVTSGNIIETISLCLILAGGIANMIDRIRLKYVVDFIDFRLINFAIFNIADSFIVIGISIFAIYTLFIHK